MIMFLKIIKDISMSYKSYKGYLVKVAAVGAGFGLTLDYFLKNIVQILKKFNFARSIIRKSIWISRLGYHYPRSKKSKRN